MNNQPIQFRPDTLRDPLPKAISDAAVLAQQLQDEGIEIHSAFDNGRRMVLLIERAPASVQGSIKRHHPNGRGGITSVFAASYRGCQLEWMTDTVGDREVSHG